MPRTDVMRAIDRVDPDLGAFIELDPDAALRAAEAAPGGQLSGVLIAVKDLVDTAGIRTTYGSARYADHVPAADAPLVAGLRERGAVVLGKTNLNEFAYGVSALNPHYGATLAPADRARTAGGSSSGSAAAVSAGVCRIAVGTDTSGSVRIPAACCGVYGFKVAHGALPLQGVHPLAARYDSAGFLAASVEDLQLVLALPDLPDVAHLRVGRLGVDLEVPALPAAHWTVFRKEVWDVHGEAFERDPSSYGADLQWKLRRPFGDLPSAERTLAAFRARYEEATAGLDVLIGPLLDGAAPTLAAARADYDRDEFLVGDRLLRHTPVFNQLGWPAVAVPTADGPRQVAGRPGTEAALLAVARDIGLTAADTVVA
ncbi:MAG: amidase [Actinomycetota bacterium]|nr:amidase [Actinomycetota bacterium]